MNVSSSSFVSYPTCSTCSLILLVLVVQSLVCVNLLADFLDMLAVALQFHLILLRSVSLEFCPVFTKRHFSTFKGESFRYLKWQTTSLSTNTLFRL